MDVVMILIGIFLYIFKAVVIAKIGLKAGYQSPAFIFFLALLPIGDAICLIYIAFNEFPKVKELASLCTEYKEKADEVNFVKKSNDKKKIEKENLAYTRVADELSSNSVDKGIWLKAETMTDGDDVKTKKAYIKMRVESLLMTS